MVGSRTKLLDRVLAVTLAVIMLLAMIPMSTLTAFALSYEAGSDCTEDSCTGKMQWILNPENDAHHLVCDNEKCVRNALIEAFVIHNEGEGGDDCLLCNPPHAHGSFTYSVENEGKTLVATCGSAGTCDLVDKKVSVTIEAPTNLEYDGTIKNATISGATEWKTVTGNDAPTITYNADPKTVGTYTASITVDETTASVEFTIVKGNPVYIVPTDLTAKYGETLADVVLPAGFTWDVQTAPVGEIGVNTFKATFTPSDTDNYNIVTNIDINVTVGKATGVIAAPSVSGEATQTTITLDAITPTVGDGNVEYGYVADEAKKDDPSNVTNWQAGTTFTGLEGSKTYYFYARVSETTNYTAAVSDVSSISTKNKLNGELTISIDSWTYGDTAVDPDFQIVTGDYGLAKVEYLNLDEEGVLYSEVVPTKAGHYRARVSCDATAIYAEAAEYCDFEIKQKEVTIEWSNTSVVYNAQNQKPVATITAGIVDSDDLTVVVSGEEKNVGVDYTAEATLGGAAKDNYVIKSNKTQLFTITAKEVAITWTNTSLTHNKDHQKPTATINDGEIFAGDVVNVEVSGAKKRPGTYTATATLNGSESTNYVIKTTMSSVEFVISNLDIPADPFTIVKVSDGSVANANNNHWYNYNIKIIPKDGYKIGTADGGDSDFGNELTITDSKQNYKVFLRDSLGRYTGEISIGNTFGNVDGNLNIDKTNPTVSVKLNADNIWDTFLNTISFGAYDRFFNTTQTVTIIAEDKSDPNVSGNSGIESVSYHVSNVGMSLDTVKGLADSEWTQGTSVTFAKDNDYVVYTKIVDKAGNITYASSDGFVYDDTKPVIEVSFDNNNATNEKYFKANRTATIKITEHNFDATKVVLSVTENGVNTSSDYSLNWSTNDDEHTATVLFENEADYTFAISVTDKAGNENQPVVYAVNSKATNVFTVDKSKPDAELVIEGLVKDAADSWKESWKTENDDVTDQNDRVSDVLTSIDYDGRWSWNNAKVSATSTDNLSGVDYLEYFRTENVVTDITADNITWSNSTKASNTKDAFSFEVEPNEKFIVYVHIVDKAGNDIYLSSNGVIVDDKEPGGDNYSPEIDITLSKANVNGFFNKSDTVKVDFKVVEPKYSDADNKVDTGTYSGIKKIKYVIKADDINAVEENTFDLHNGSVTDNNGLISSWTGSITIDKEKFNSNNVVVLITAVDNAGNVHTSMTKVGDIKIDITNPTIGVTYNNNAADSSNYFKSNRTATIVVTERNFNADDVKVSITNTDGVVPKIGKWTKTKGTGNADNTKWTTTVTYNSDGDYTFDVSCVDLADNKCNSVDYGKSVAPKKFTIDKTTPVVSVSYDNNNAKNGKYFDASRTATVVIREHNFNVNRVQFIQDSSLDGKAIATPKVNWVNKGNVHTATIVFDKDGDYKFDVVVNDLAGNKSKAANFGKSVAGKDFVVDKTIEKPTVSGVKNGGAYKGDVVPAVAFNDVNYDTYKIELVRTRNGDRDKVVTSEFIKGITESAQGGTGSFNTFKKIVENDGIYTLTVQMMDKAGNTAREEYKFTINRFGSVYEYSDELVALIKDGGQYIQSVDKDLVITEYNASRILEGSLKLLVTRDGESVDVDYTTTPVINNQVGVGTSGWYQYVYTIKASNFAKDGVYKISLASAYSTDDSAKNDSTSVPDNTIGSDKNKFDSMTFTVDSVAPEIRNIINLDKAVVDVEKIVDGELNVKYTVIDVGGLKSVEVMLNGKKIATETFGEKTYSFDGNFKIAEKDSAKKQDVRIIVTDLAGNVTDTDSADFLKEHANDNKESVYVFCNEVTVSRNFFVRWFANPIAFWGSIGGVVVVAAGVTLLFKLRRRKK